MGKITLTKAFADYGATLRNVRWAVSAIAKDGSLVFTCWSHLFKPQPDGCLRYDDTLSRWQGNFIGRDLLREHLTQAFNNKLPVRLFVATLKEPEVVTADASTQSKEFSVRKDFVGRVVKFDGNRYVIDYQKDHLVP